eukprot:m.77205 g.77205  ORF g.77205 m.77205 type:complete len:197 (-) comp14538_c0_seq4:66-656(-)
MVAVAGGILSLTLACRSLQPLEVPFDTRQLGLLFARRECCNSGLRSSELHDFRLPSGPGDDARAPTGQSRGVANSSNPKTGEPAATAATTVDGRDGADQEPATPAPNHGTADAPATEVPASADVTIAPLDSVDDVPADGTAAPPTPKEQSRQASSTLLEDTDFNRLLHTPQLGSSLTFAPYCPPLPHGHVAVCSYL